MGMTIDEQIKALEYLKKCGIFPFSDTKTGIVITDEYVDGVIDTMHKYQKIEQIIEDWESDKGWTLEMTIEQIIKYLPAPICGDTVIGKEKQKEYNAHDSAVIILRKYQKIQQILKSLDDGEISYPQMAYYLREVLEDGNGR